MGVGGFFAYPEFFSPPFEVFLEPLGLGEELPVLPPVEVGGGEEVFGRVSCFEVEPFEGGIPFVVAFFEGV